jgi:tetratricopeptide (TPR) repeat protein
MAQHRPEFGRRQAYVAPQGGHTQSQSPNRLRNILIFVAMPIIGFLLVSLCWRSATFTFSYKVTLPGDDAKFSQDFKWCEGKDGTKPERQIAGCTGMIESGRGNDNGLAMAFYNRGNGYAAEGNFDEAIENYDEAIKHNPGLAVAFSNRGNAYKEEGQYERALADYDVAIGFNASNPIALQNRCWTRFMVGQLSEALSDCNESLRVRPDNASTLSDRGLIHLKMEALDKAIADFDMALDKNPKIANALYGRGLVKLKQGDTDADIGAAEAAKPNVATEFARFGVQ